MPIIVAIEVTAVSPSYGTIAMPIAWIRIPYVESVAEVKRRSYVEIRVGVIIPRSPHRVVIVPCDHSRPVVRRIGFDLNVLQIDALLTFRYDVEFHHSIDLMVVC